MLKLRENKIEIKHSTWFNYPQPKELFCYSLIHFKSVKSDKALIRISVHTLYTAECKASLKPSIQKYLQNYSGCDFLGLVCLTFALNVLHLLNSEFKNTLNEGNLVQLVFSKDSQRYKYDSVDILVNVA